MFTTWGYKIRMSKAFAIGTADDLVGVLADFSGATRLAAQPKGQKNNLPAIARCKTISSRQYDAPSPSPPSPPASPPLCLPNCMEWIDAGINACESAVLLCSGCASCL